ncbi:MAG: heparan-alpha-glucosaminide N-acetyltransferase [Chloroflexota bacterium]
MKQRFWEIDTLRGIAIVMMIIYHFLWSLYFFGYVQFETLISPFWKYFQRSIACNFVMLVGVSLVVSHIAARQAAQNKQATRRPKRKQSDSTPKPWWIQVIPYGWFLIVPSALFIAIMASQPIGKLQRVIAIVYLIVLSATWLWEKFGNAGDQQGVYKSRSGFSKSLWRGLWVFGWGMVVSTSVAVGGTGSVDFGVLHLIGFSIIASYPFLNFRWINLGLWLLFNMVGYYLMPARADDIWFVWLGWRPDGYAAVDFFPIFPWFGVVLLGIAIGNFVYSEDGRTFSLPDLSEFFPPNMLQWLGKRSLFIYLIHQPIIFAILSILVSLGLI